MCVSEDGVEDRRNKAFCSSSWKWLFCQESEFSDLNVEGEMGNMFLVRLYVRLYDLSIWQEQSLLLGPELMVLSGLCEETSQ